MCVFANSSETNGRIYLIFGGKMHVIPRSDLIYFSLPYIKGRGHHEGQGHPMKNQFCPTGSFYTLFFSYWRAEQISYRNICSKMNFFTQKRAIYTENGAHPTYYITKINFVLHGCVIPHFLGIGNLNLNFESILAFATKCP